MRVKISYGVELEKVPEKASELSYDALIDLKESIRSLERAVESVEDAGNNFSAIIQTIEKNRLKLTKIDSILEDVSLIFKGLQDYYNGEKNVSDRRPIVDPSGDPTE
jgi:seryl-tRNA synthetase